MTTTPTTADEPRVDPDDLDSVTAALTRRGVAPNAITRDTERGHLVVRLATGTVELEPCGFATMDMAVRDADGREQEGAGGCLPVRRALEAVADLAAQSGR